MSKLTQRDVVFLSRLEGLPSVRIVNQKLVYTFNRRLPSGNTLLKHWGANASYKKTYLNDLALLPISPDWLDTTPVKLTVYRYSPKELDITNETIKPLEDAIKEKGIIPDDTKKHVKQIIFKEVKSKEKKTILVIERL